MSPRDRKANEQESTAEQPGDEAAQEVKGRTGVEEKPPSGPEELREEIRETREDLGDTVEALAGKADVKGQAKQTLDERKEQLRQRQEQAKAKVRERQERARATVTEVGAKVRNTTPQQAREAAGRVAHQARERPLPFALAGAFATGLLLGRRLGSR